jgi:hypothetical protein
MVVVGRLVAKMYEENDDDVGNKVAQRVYGIGNHSRRVANDSGGEFQHDKHSVYKASDQRYVVNSFVSVHYSYIVLLRFANLLKKNVKGKAKVKKL